MKDLTESLKLTYRIHTVQLTKSDETSTSELGLPAMKDLDTNEAIMKIINILCDP